MQIVLHENSKKKNYKAVNKLEVKLCVSRDKNLKTNLKIAFNVKYQYLKQGRATTALH